MAWSGRTASVPSYPMSDRGFCYYSSFYFQLSNNFELDGNNLNIGYVMSPNGCYCSTITSLGSIFKVISRKFS